MMQKVGRAKRKVKDIKSANIRHNNVGNNHKGSRNIPESNVGVKAESVCGRREATKQKTWAEEVDETYPIHVNVIEYFPTSNHLNLEALDKQFEATVESGCVPSKCNSIPDTETKDDPVITQIVDRQTIDVLYYNHEEPIQDEDQTLKEISEQSDQLQKCKEGQDHSESHCVLNEQMQHKDPASKGSIKEIVLFKRPKEGHEQQPGISLQRDILAEHIDGEDLAPEASGKQGNLLEKNKDGQEPSGTSLQHGGFVEVHLSRTQAGSPTELRCTDIEEKVPWQKPVHQGVMAEVDVTRALTGSPIELSCNDMPSQENQTKPTNSNIKNQEIEATHQGDYELQHPSSTQRVGNTVKNRSTLQKRTSEEKRKSRHISNEDKQVTRNNRYVFHHNVNGYAPWYCVRVQYNMSNEHSTSKYYHDLKNIHILPNQNHELEHKKWLENNGQYIFSNSHYDYSSHYPVHSNHIYGHSNHHYVHNNYRPDYSNHYSDHYNYNHVNHHSRHSNHCSGHNKNNSIHDNLNSGNNDYCSSYNDRHRGHNNHHYGHNKHRSGHITNRSYGFGAYLSDINYNSEFNLTNNHSDCGKKYSDLNNYVYDHSSYHSSYKDYNNYNVCHDKFGFRNYNYNRDNYYFYGHSDDITHHSDRKYYSNSSYRPDHDIYHIPHHIKHPFDHYKYNSDFTYHYDISSHSPDYNNYRSGHSNDSSDLNNNYLYEASF